MDARSPHSLWRSLAAWTFPQEADDHVGIVHHPLEPTADWRDDLRSVLSDAGTGQTVVVTYDRGPLERLRGALTRTGAGAGRAPSPRTVRTFLDGWGCSRVWCFGIWPTVTSPRLAFPHGHLPGVGWLQSSGLWGGGGDSLLLRGVARHLPRPRHLQRLAPGIAVVFRPAQEPTR